MATHEDSAFPERPALTHDQICRLNTIRADVADMYNGGWSHPAAPLHYVYDHLNWLLDLVDAQYPSRYDGDEELRCADERAQENLSNV